MSKSQSTIGWEKAAKEEKMEVKSKFTSYGCRRGGGEERMVGVEEEERKGTKEEELTRRRGNVFRPGQGDAPAL